MTYTPGTLATIVCDDRARDADRGGCTKRATKSFSFRNWLGRRVIARSAGGNVTLFAFDAGQELSEHTTPFDAVVIVLEGALTLTIGGTPVHPAPGTIVRMPANVPHAVHAPEAARMLLLMLKDSDRS